jgi:septal ring factor EnvC (AmiA/AmiB activator)
MDPALLYAALFKFVRSKIFAYGLVSLSLFGWYKYTDWTIKSLRDKTEQQAIEIRTLNEALNNVRQDYENVTKSMKRLEVERQRSVSKLEELRKTIYRENQKKKSLEELAKSKTPMVEKRINEATEKKLKCFEKLVKGELCED